MLPWFLVLFLTFPDMLQGYYNNQLLEVSSEYQLWCELWAIYNH